MFNKIKEYIQTIRVYKQEFYNYPFLILKLLFPFSKRYTTFILKDKTQFKGRSGTLDYLIIKENYSDESYIIPGFEIKNSDIVIDIGAHIGVFSVFASRKAKNGKVYAYEPDPENYYLLQHNTKANHCDNVISFKKGVLLTRRMELNISKNVAGHSLANILNPNGEKIVVDCISLQDLFNENQISHCDFLKIDIEGSEYELFFNLPISYFERIRKIVLEYHLFNEGDSDKLTRLELLLDKLKYKYFKKRYDVLRGVIFARKDSS